MAIAISKCHPPKQNFGGGLCANCYYRKKYREDPDYRKNHLKNSRAWERLNREKFRGYKLKYRHKITTEKYKELFDKQNGLCALCGKSEEAGITGKRLVIDHDHKCCPSHERTCGKCIRALLHSECNYILGWAKDDPELLRQAANYLEKLNGR